MKCNSIKCNFINCRKRMSKKNAKVLFDYEKEIHGYYCVKHAKELIERKIASRTKIQPPNTPQQFLFVK